MHGNKLRDESDYNAEINRFFTSWGKKPLLRDIYTSFYKLISEELTHGFESNTVELGSAIGIIKKIIPNCVTTDLFPNPWIDQVEDSYHLSFGDGTVDNIILFDVLHHLRYPGTALQEIHRVLTRRGKLIIFDISMSLLGLIVFGPLHHEDLGIGKKIQMFAPAGWRFEKTEYYSAVGNSFRIFFGKKYRTILKNWRVVKKKRISAVSYVASGGYYRTQFYPYKAFPLMRAIDKICDLAPLIFATRLLVVLEKR